MYFSTFQEGNTFSSSRRTDLNWIQHEDSSLLFHPLSFLQFYHQPSHHCLTCWFDLPLTELKGSFLMASGSQLLKKKNSASKIKVCIYLAKMTSSQPWAHIEIPWGNLENTDASYLPLGNDVLRT